MPETMEAVQDIIGLLKDQDSNVKAMAVWTLGKMGP
jgi:HEAT repeat protein